MQWLTGVERILILIYPIRVTSTVLTLFFFFGKFRRLPESNLSKHILIMQSTIANQIIGRISSSSRCWGALPFSVFFCPWRLSHQHYHVFLGFFFQPPPQTHFLQREDREMSALCVLYPPIYITDAGVSNGFLHIATGFCKTEFFLHNHSPNLFWWTRKKKESLTGHTGWFCGPYCSGLKVITILLKYLATVPDSQQLQELFLFFDQTIPKHENETSHTGLLYAHQVETKRSCAKIK